MLKTRLSLIRRSRIPEGTIGTVARPRCELPHVVCRRFLVSDAVPGERVLDVGCGRGELMKEFASIGCVVSGTEIGPQLIDLGLAKGLDVRRGPAENLPFESNSFDRVLCSVVLPYTDEPRAVAEWARVIKPGGRIFASYHGVGYALHQIFRPKKFHKRIYGARTLLNTWSYWVTGQRLPGFLGNSLCQGKKQLDTYYNSSGLELERELVVDTFASYPRFLCHQLRKPLTSDVSYPVTRRHAV